MRVIFIGNGRDDPQTVLMNGTPFELGVETECNDPVLCAKLRTNHHFKVVADEQKRRGPGRPRLTTPRSA